MIFKEIVDYLNSLPMGTQVTINEVYEFLIWESNSISWSKGTIQTYVSFLIKKGYLKRIDKGVYTVENRIELEVNVGDVRRDAARKPHAIQTVPPSRA